MADETTYRIYVTDSLRLQNQGGYLATRYIDLIEPKHKGQGTNEREKTADEIAMEVIAKAGLKVGE